MTEIEQLWMDYKRSSDIELRNRLMLVFLPLVKYQASKLANRLPKNVSYPDLVSAGTFGLMDAIDKYDPGLGTKFETFATMRIRGAILDDLRQKSWVPRLTQARHQQYDKAHTELQLLLGRPPSHDELSGRMGIPAAKVARLEVTRITHSSLNAINPTSYREASKGDELIDQTALDPSHRTQLADLARMVCRGLNEQERLVVMLYYYDELTMKEIGKVLDLSESRVSQMHSNILGRLRKNLKNRVEEFSPD